ncbi:hypothetical protein ACJW30_11G058600 [Castanea mollissima]
MEDLEWPPHPPLVLGPKRDCHMQKSKWEIFGPFLQREKPTISHCTLIIYNEHEASVLLRKLKNLPLIPIKYNIVITSSKHRGRCDIVNDLHYSIKITNHLDPFPLTSCKFSPTLEYEKINY